jgi:hypothetical protein
MKHSGEVAMVGGFIARQPMGCVGLSEKTGAAALYLMSSDPTIVTGAALATGGGFGT